MPSPAPTHDLESSRTRHDNVVALVMSFVVLAEQEPRTPYPARRPPGSTARRRSRARSRAPYVRMASPSQAPGLRRTASRQGEADSDWTHPGYRLHIEDGFGRTSDRVVAEPAMAVSLIESWAVDEDADLLTASALPAAAPTVVVASGASVEATSQSRFWGSLNSALASDGSLWAGGSLNACARWGPLCVGGQLDALRDTGTRGPTSDGGATRTTADLLLMGAMPADLRPTDGHSLFGCGRRVAAQRHRR